MTTSRVFFPKISALFSQFLKKGRAELPASPSSYSPEVLDSKLPGKSTALLNAQLTWPKTKARGTFCKEDTFSDNVSLIYFNSLKFGLVGRTIHNDFISEIVFVKWVFQTTLFEYFERTKMIQEIKVAVVTKKTFLKLYLIGCLIKPYIKFLVFSHSMRKKYLPYLRNKKVNYLSNKLFYQMLVFRTRLFAQKI